jgi:hypothetical protein
MSESADTAGRRAAEPRPVAEVDQNLLDQLRPLHRIRWITLTGYALVVTAALIFLVFAAAGFRSQLHATQRQLAAARAVVTSQQEEIKASCRFYRTAAGLPLRPTPPLTRPSPVVVTLIASSRDAYGGERCGPPLGPPPPGLVSWARTYGVPLNG